MEVSMESLHIVYREDRRCVRRGLLSVGGAHPLVSIAISPPGIRPINESCDRISEWKVEAANPKVIGVEVLGFATSEAAAKQLVTERYTPRD